MQPNIPQARYPISPVYKIPRNTIIDISTDKLMEQKLREAQYAAQQSRAASRVPKVLTDPLLNLRVRDHYRQKYERNLLTEASGRAIGGVEGGLTGAGIGAGIGAAIGAIAGAVIPTVGEEWVLISSGASLGTKAAALISSSLMGAKWGVSGGTTIGAAIGAGIGATAADYSTYHATVDMFGNMWRPGQPVGENILNTLYFVGQSSELASITPLVKSSLYGLITGDNVIETVKKAYGLDESGREDMDFSRIREAMELDLGGVGNFVFDMTGELASDIGAISGITSGTLLTSKSMRKVFASEIINNAGNIFNKSLFDSKTFKRYIRLIDEDRVDDIVIDLLKDTEHQSEAFKELIKNSIEYNEPLSILKKAVKKFRDEVYIAARRSRAYEFLELARAYDAVDDNIAKSLWTVGSPVIAGSRIFRYVNKTGLINKLLPEGFLKFVQGHNYADSDIIDINDKESLMKAVVNYNLKFKNGLHKNADFYRTANTLLSQEDRVTYSNILNEGLSIQELIEKASSDPLYAEFLTKIKNGYESKLKVYTDKLEELKKVKTKHAVDSIEYSAASKQIDTIVSNPEYQELSIFKTIFDHPESYSKLVKYQTVLNILSSKYRFHKKIKLTKEEQEMVDEVLSDILKAYDEGDELISSFLENMDSKVSNFISKSASHFISQQFKMYYSDYYAHVLEFANKELIPFKRNLIKHMKQLLPEYDLNNIDSLFGRQLSDVEKRLLITRPGDLKSPDDVNKVYRLLNELLSSDETLVKKLTSGGNFSHLEIQAKYEKAINKLNDMQKKFKFFDVKGSSDFDAIPRLRYSIYIDNNQVQKKHTAKLLEMINRIQQFMVDNKEIYLTVDKYMQLIEEYDIGSEVYVHNLLEALMSVSAHTGRVSRMISRNIPDYVNEMYKALEVGDIEKIKSIIYQLKEYSKEFIIPELEILKLLEGKKPEYFDDLEFIIEDIEQLYGDFQNIADFEKDIINAKRLELLKLDIEYLGITIVRAQNDLVKQSFNELVENSKQFSLNKESHKILNKMQNNKQYIEELKNTKYNGYSLYELISMSLHQNIKSVDEINSLLKIIDRIFEYESLSDTEFLFKTYSLFHSVIIPNLPKEVGDKLKKLLKLIYEQDALSFIDGVRGTYSSAGRALLEYQKELTSGIDILDVVKHSIAPLLQGIERQQKILKTSEDTLNVNEDVFEGFDSKIVSTYNRKTLSDEEKIIVNEDIVTKATSNKWFRESRFYRALELAQLKYGDVFKYYKDRIFKLLNRATPTDIEIFEEVEQLITELKTNIDKIQTLTTLGFNFNYSITNNKFTINVNSKDTKLIKLINDLADIMQDNKFDNASNAFIEKRIAAIQQLRQDYLTLKNIKSTDTTLNPLLEFKKSDPENYKALEDLFNTLDNPNKSADFTNNIVKSNLDDIFKDLFGVHSQSYSAFIRQSKRHKIKAKATDNTYTVIDIENLYDETEATDRKLIYQIAFNEYVYDRKSKKWVAKSKKQIMLDPNSPDFVNNKDLIGVKTDTLNASTEIVSGATLSRVNDAFNNTPVEFRFSSEQELKQYFLDNINRNSIFIAHNASFDAGELFTEDDDVNVLDSQLIEELFGFLGLGKNSSYSNSAILKYNENAVDVIEIYSNGDITLNGKLQAPRLNRPLSVEDLPRKNKNVLLVKHLEDGTTKEFYNGKHIHEAQYDVDITWSWISETFDRMDSNNITIKDLQDFTNVKQRLISESFNTTFKDSKEINECIKLITDFLQNKNTDNIEYIQKSLDILQSMKEGNLRYSVWLDYMIELQSNIYGFKLEHIETYKDPNVLLDSSKLKNIEDPIVDAIEKIIERFDSIDKQITRKLERRTNLSNNANIYFQTNKTYVAAILALQIYTDHNFHQLYDLFNNNSNGTLQGNLAETAKMIDKEYKNDIGRGLIETRDKINAIYHSAYWYNEFCNKVSRLDNQPYDIFDQIIKFLSSMDIEDAKLKINEYLSQPNVKKYIGNQIEFDEVLQELLNNPMHIGYINGSSISDMYNSILTNLVGLFTSLSTTAKEKAMTKTGLEAVEDLSTEIKKLVEQSLEGIRLPLQVYYKENKLLQTQRYTIQQYNRLARQIDDTIVKPHEVVGLNARYVPVYNYAMRQQMSLKQEINRMLGDKRVNLFKDKTSQDANKMSQIGLVSARNSRLSQLFIQGANTLGISPEEYIELVTRSDMYLDFVNPKLKTQYIEMFDSLTSDIDVLQQYGLDNVQMRSFLESLNSINEISFSYISDVEKLKDILKATFVYNLLYGKAHRELNVNRSFFTDNFNRDAFTKAVSNFQEVKSLYTNIDGTVDEVGFQKYLQSHPEYDLVYLDKNGRFHKLDSKNPETVRQALNVDSKFITLMSHDVYLRMISQNQPIKIKNPVIHWVHNNIIRPIKMLSLTSLSFMINNIITANYQNMRTFGSKINFFEAASEHIQAFKDYNFYQSIQQEIINSNSIRDFINPGSRYDYDMGWLDLLDNEEFMEALKKENILAWEHLKSLTKEQRELLQELNEFTHSSASFGQINDVSKYSQLAKKRVEEAEKAKKELEEIFKKYNIKVTKEGDLLTDLDENNIYGIEPSELSKIKDLQRQFSSRYYDRLPTKKLLELQEVYSRSHSTMDKYNVITNIINARKNKNSIVELGAKYTGLQWWLNLNTNIETCVRLAAIRGYMKYGASFDEATFKVMQNQFLYNNKSEMEMYAEILIPFVSYPLRMLNLLSNMTDDYVATKLIFQYDKNIWKDEETGNSEYLTRRRARGDIPVGNKLVSIGNPLTETLMTGTNPIYTLNNKLNPLAKPIVDKVTGSEYVRWNQLPGVSIVSNVTRAINDRNPFTNMMNDFYRYENFGNYYLPRVNNRIRGSLYNRMYTANGYSRISMNMQNLNSSNLKYRVNAIMKYSGPTSSRL